VLSFAPPARVPFPTHAPAHTHPYLFPRGVGCRGAFTNRRQAPRAFRREGQAWAAARRNKYLNHLRHNFYYPLFPKKEATERRWTYLGLVSSLLALIDIRPPWIFGCLLSNGGGKEDRAIGDASRSIDRRTHRLFWSGNKIKPHDVPTRSIQARALAFKSSIDQIHGPIASIASPRPTPALPLTGPDSVQPR
jgi:hypothetical protein